MSNKSLDASGGSVFLNLLGAAEGALIRAAASTQPLGCYFLEIGTYISPERLIRMTMFRPALLIPILFVVSANSCSHTTQPTQLTYSTPNTGVTPTPSPAKETPTADRNLSAYAFGGHLGCKTPLIRESSRCQSSLRQARDFIWNHWRDKKNGYLVVTMTSPDAASDVHIFIEPDDAGTWHVLWRSENLYCASCPRPDTPGTIYQSPELRSIEQKRAGGTDINWPVGTRYLVFLDASGNEVERL